MDGPASVAMDRRVDDRANGHADCLPRGIALPCGAARPPTLARGAPAFPSFGRSSHSASASEHEAQLNRLKQQLEEAESGYRQARGVKATLEAEVGSVRAQLEEALAQGVQLRSSLEAVKGEHETALATKEREATNWKAKWKAQSATNAETAASLEAAEKRVLTEAASHAAALATVERRSKELQEQLESGRPQEQHMFTMAREQAKRDEEVTRLRAQLKSLRDMLKESHKVCNAARATRTS